MGFSLSDVPPATCLTPSAGRDFPKGEVFTFATKDVRDTGDDHRYPYHVECNKSRNCNSGTWNGH